MQCPLLLRIRAKNTDTYFKLKQFIFDQIWQIALELLVLLSATQNRKNKERPLTLYFFCRWIISAFRILPRPLRPPLVQKCDEIYNNSRLNSSYKLTTYSSKLPAFSASHTPNISFRVHKDQMIRSRGNSYYLFKELLENHAFTRRKLPSSRFQVWQAP